MKFKFLLLTLFTFFAGLAQNATIKGTVTDKDMNGETLPFATVSIKGTSIISNTDENGNYTLSVPAGTHTITYAFLGYADATETVTVAAGETKTINKELQSDSVMLEDVVIETTFSREKESALLLEQRNATVITQTIGAQEMARKGASDAEGAVTKMTGVSKQQGEKNVFVRGLGDRYNSTTYNGLPLPSEDPVTKNISLDFFTSDVIQNINVNKTFGSTISGDVAGANIDIESKEFSGDDFIQIGIASGMNTQTYNKDFFIPDGSTFMGFTDKKANISNLSDYGFENSMDPSKQSSQIATGLSVKGGRRFQVGEENSLSMFLTGSFDNGYLYREGKVRQTNNLSAITQDMDFKKYTYNVSQTLMANLKYRFGANNISFNSLYIHDNTQELGDYFGFNTPEEEGDLDFIKRQQILNNSLWVNQILSEITLNENMKLDLRAGYNMIRTSEPDRRTNNFLFRDGTFRPNSDSAGSHERYFGTMDEDDISGKAIFTYNFNNESKTRIDAGLDTRFTKRNFETLIFNHSFSNSETVIDLDNLGGIFNQQSLDNGVFGLQTGRASSMNNPDAFLPFYWEGKRSAIAGLVNFTHMFTEKLTLVAGARFEKINQEVDYNTNIATNETFGDAKIDETYVLPNLNLKYALNDKNILRLAASMSYTLPQFIEIAPFKNQDITGSTQGNNNLVPSENYNFDLKWEFYPENDELIALTGFYKHIKNPINRAEIPGNTLTFFNTGAEATVAGAELELKKNIYKITSPDNDNESIFSGGINVSYLYNMQDLDQTLIAQFTNSSDGLQGAAPLLANADLSFTRNTENWKLNSSVVFNYFSDRIYAIGTRGFQNVIETGIPTLDFITQTSIGEHYGISLKARNLLNPTYTLVREGGQAGIPEVTLSEFKRGLDISLGLSYKF